MNVMSKCVRCDGRADFKWSWGVSQAQYWCDRCFDEVHTANVVELKDMATDMCAETKKKNLN